MSALSRKGQSRASRRDHHHDNDMKSTSIPTPLPLSSSPTQMATSPPLTITANLKNDSGNETANSTSNCSSTTTTDQKDFINVGLIRWTRQREKWTTPSADYKPRPKQHISSIQRVQNAEELYNALLTPSQHHLPRKVPLSELVTILQEVREISN